MTIVEFETESLLFPPHPAIARVIVFTYGLRN